MWTYYQHFKFTGHGDTHLTDGLTDRHTNELLYAYGAPCIEA